MKKSSEVLGLRMIGIQEGMENGIAQDFMIDTSTKLVKYMILKTSSGYGFRVMKVTDIQAIGADYIITKTVENAVNIYESKDIMEEIEKGFFILGTTVLSSSGDIIGTVADFSFEEKTGKMDVIMLDDGNEFSADKIATLAGKMVFIDPTGQSMQEDAVADAEEPFVPEPVFEPVADVVEEIAVEGPVAAEGIAEVMIEDAPVIEPEIVAPEPEPVVEPAPVVEPEAVVPEPVAEPVIAPEPVVEPEPVIEPEPVAEPEPEKSALEMESMAFLLGKTVKSEVVSDDGQFRLEPGTELTQEIINLADKHDAILTLTLSV